MSDLNNCDDLKNKILLIVPHQDDEMLVGNKLLLELAKRAEYSIHIIFVTNGDFYPHEKDIRLNESLKGLLSLGIVGENVVFLGYRDSCIINEVHPYNCDDYCKKYFTSGLKNHPEFSYEKYGEHHAYTRENVKQDLKDCICDFVPSAIICYNMCRYGFAPRSQDGFVAIR